MSMEPHCPAKPLLDWPGQIGHPHSALTTAQAVLFEALASRAVGRDWSGRWHDGIVL